MKKPNKVGGGARTNQLGLLFEQTTSLKDALEKIPGFRIRGDVVYRNNEQIALLCGKNKLYKNLLAPKGIDARRIVSKLLLPDEAILVNNTIYIIEKKFQSGAGSVDEKLQTCDFKKKQYTKLFKPLGISVEYIYVLSDWFKQAEYKDVHAYIRDVGCRYYFNQIPLDEIGL